MGRLDGKVAIITGSASGFGEATATLWAKEGAKLVLADWNAETGEKVAKKINDDGGEATFIKTDVSKSEDVQRMVKTAVDKYGKLDIIFNNAGIQGSTTRGPMDSRNIEDMNEKDADKFIDINIKGVFFGMKYAIPEIIKAGGGSIISTASICATQACGGYAIYAATKGAVVSMSQSVAREAGCKGIRVNTISPMTGHTPAVDLLFDTIPDGAKKMQALADQVPMCRLAEVEDIANAALFLASDESKYISGHNLLVDGGWNTRGQ